MDNEHLPKMHWNHRIIKDEVEFSDGTKHYKYWIGEVYYEDDEPIGLGNATTLESFCLEDFSIVLDWCKQALEAPVIDAKEFRDSKEVLG